MQRHVAGGRDFDRILFNDFVVPWLEDNYALPDDWLSLDEYKKLCSVATYLAENSKIELSSSDAVTIQGEIGGVNDEDGEEIYLDVPIDRESFSDAIDELVTKAIETARSTIDKSGLTSDDISKIIFIGDPSTTNRFATGSSTNWASPAVSKSTR